VPKDMVEPTLVVIEPAAFGVTHTGTFHADDALAAALLRVLPQYAHAELRRSRDARDVKHDGGLVPVFWVARAAQFGVGVLGQDAEESRRRFDHHQRGFDHVFGHGFNTKLSSAGLIYKLRSPFWVARAAQFGVGVLGQDAEESGGEGVVGVEGSCAKPPPPTRSSAPTAPSSALTAVRPPSLLSSAEQTTPH
jgi:hypothetical protein